MELNVDALQSKALAMMKDNLEFATAAQKEIDSLQQQAQQLQQGIQAKHKDAQRKVDLMDGKVKAIQDLIREMGGTPKDLQGNPVLPEQSEKPADAPAS